MRTRTLAVLVSFALAVAACKHGGSAKLEGHWKGIKADGVPTEALARATDFAQRTEITAQGNQISISTPAAKNQTGTYFVDKEDATTLVIHTDKDGTTETFTFDEKGDQMVWKIDALRSITFQKVR